MFIAIGKASLLLGVATTTLRRWDKTNKLNLSFRTVGGHRKYRYTTISEFITDKKIPIKDEQITDNFLPRAVTYALVSAVKQKDELYRQEQHFFTRIC